MIAICTGIAGLDDIWIRLAQNIMIDREQPFGSHSTSIGCWPKMAFFRYFTAGRKFVSMSISYTAEKQVAISAVRRACVLTDLVFNKLVKNETLTKDDKSPVTGELASPDFIICLLLLMIILYSRRLLCASSNKHDPLPRFPR